MKRVLFEVLWPSAHDGWARAARTYARAMKLAGLKVELWSPRQLERVPDREVLEEVGDMFVPFPGDWDIYIYSVPLMSLELMRSRLEPALDCSGKRIFYTMFERTAIEPELIKILQKFDGVMVPCKRNANTLFAAGCKNVKWIPFPYFPDDPHLGLELPTDKPRFLWVGRWEPRKAPDNLIRAFLRAFRPGEATLTLKLGPAPWQHSPFPSPEEVIDTELAELRLPVLFGAEDIHVIREKLSIDAMVDLHRQANIYASASRGEGIDLPAFSAKLAGRRVVTTDSGGPVDFLDADDVLIPARGTIPAQGYEKLWGPTSRFVDYDLDKLVLGMQEAVRRPLQKSARPVHSVARVAERIREWFDRL